MNENRVRARIQVKNDIEAHWNLARNFVPKSGEIIVYAVDDNHAAPRIKVGDGTTIVVDLPFVETDTARTDIEVNTTAYWNSLPEYVPSYGNIIIYTDKSVKDGVNIPGIKIGDGVAYCIDLPFVGDDTLYTLTTHINNTSMHITDAERTFWNNKLNYNDNVVEENLQLTRN